MSKTTFNPISVSLANVDAINEALLAVNGRATSFTVTSARSVIDIAADLENRLERMGVAKADRVGSTATYLPAGPSANAYKYGAKSTQLQFARNSSGWKLVGISADTVYPRNAEVRALKLTDAALIKHIARQVIRAGHDPRRVQIAA